ncbi:MAG: hypothetical protein QOJ40_1520 [Verrucomicrobiota bacterium]
MLGVLGTACWAVCFFWMHRISSRQNALLDEIRRQGKTIEQLSRAEHDLIKEVHPQVSDIREGVQEVVAAVREDAKSQ